MREFAKKVMVGAANATAASSWSEEARVHEMEGRQVNRHSSFRLGAIDGSLRDIEEVNATPPALSILALHRWIVAVSS